MGKRQAVKVAKVEQIDPHYSKPGECRFLKRKRVRAVRRSRGEAKGYKGYNS